MVEETRDHGVNQWLAASHWKTYHIKLYQVHLSKGWESNSLLQWLRPSKGKQPLSLHGDKCRLHMKIISKTASKKLKDNNLLNIFIVLSYHKVLIHKTLLQYRYVKNTYIIVYIYPRGVMNLYKIYMYILNNNDLNNLFLN